MEPHKTIPQSTETYNPAPQAEYIPSGPTPPVPPPQKVHSENLRSVLSTFAILLSAILVAVALTAFVFQSYEVDGSSMETTLQNHDRLIVSKIPHTLSRITGKDYIPNRGDVIIFNTTAIQDGRSNGGSRQLIKRVVGLPGDRVVVKDEVITVYNAQYPEGFNPDKAEPYGSVIKNTPGNVDVTVRAGEVFVCGDNRTNSTDSRYIGAIPSDDIIGKLIFRIYPLSNAKVF